MAQSIEEIESICERDMDKNSPRPWASPYWDADQDEDGWDTITENEEE